MQAKKKGKKPPKGPAKYPQGVRRDQVRLIDPNLVANDFEEDKKLLLSGNGLWFELGTEVSAAPFAVKSPMHIDLYFYGC